MPLNQINYLEDGQRIPKNKFKIEKISELEFDSKRSGNFEQFANAKVLGVFRGDSEKKYEYLKSRKLKLVEFRVLPRNMEKAINEAPVALRRLIEYGSKGRVVNKIFVVVEAQLASQLAASGSLNAEVSVKAVTAGGQTSGGVRKKSTVKLSEGMCFAYQLLKLKWKRVNGKKQVVGSSIDEHGIN